MVARDESTLGPTRLDLGALPEAVAVHDRAIYVPLIAEFTKECAMPDETRR